MKVILWVVEENYGNTKWYPLIDYIRTKREVARGVLKIIKSTNQDARAKYRISKYERRNICD
jgi:hypothetical protein